MRKILPLLLMLSLSSCFSFFNDNYSGTDYEITDPTTFLPNKLYSTNKFSVDHLIKNWVSSSEEENSIIKVYRPNNFRVFQHIRFRGRINFYEKGICEYLVLASNDAHYFTKRRWRLFKENPNIIYLYNEKAEVVRKLLIDTLDDDLFKFTFIH